ncbi:MAG: hypothetical protein JW726_07385 [Anaerolineales bacterium]|nr:hypothetical protein [Anaerolineales bacterium]
MKETLVTPHTASSPSPARIILKGLFLFLLLNLVFAAGDSLPLLGRISAYHILFPPRLRLPYGEKPDQAYNLSLYNLPAMFASHEIASPKQAGEFRVILIGDSSVWGFLLPPEDSLSAQLNAAQIHTPQGENVRFYNLGYPTMSLTKDLLMLNQALAYQPDLVIWLLTLESFPLDKQLDSPIVQNNPQPARHLIHDYNLPLDPYHPAFHQPSFWQRTIIGQRRNLADIFRLQVYGILWAATGIDQFYPPDYDPPQENLEADPTFHSLQPPTLFRNDLAFEAMAASAAMTGELPVLFINEPIYISQGENSDIRYNFFYPRWAYDQYRQFLAQACQDNGWPCLDLWNLVPAAEYSNSAIHLTAAGEQIRARAVQQWLTEWLQTDDQ